MWEQLRGHKLSGLSFRRQHPIGGFVVDFACPGRMLVVELDGTVHNATREQDQERDNILGQHGWKVLRFRNEDLTEDLPGVLTEIAATAFSRPVVYGRKEAIPEAVA